MPGIMQEKFQVDYAQTSEAQDPGPWKSSQSARKSKSSPGRVNALPPGMNIEHQALTEQNAMPTVTSGESDISRDFSAEGARMGYQRKRMSPTEDEYTNAHADAFYDEIKVDGSTGFVERNNVLDRM